MDKARKRAIIIGAGPAGLTAAYELLARTDIVPVVLEKSRDMGGIAKTARYKGNRIDIGGHRFFSKSDRVMRWWLSFLPLQKTEGDGLDIAYQGSARSVPASAEGPDPGTEDRVMLVRERKSRIYFNRRMFDYPLRLDPSTLAKLGPVRTVRIGASYLRSMLFPLKEEKNLEQFFINRFGRELYLTFFKAYTEKVWGMPCDQISAEWGAQRIKGLSIGKAIGHFFASMFRKRGGVAQKDTETSLIERFLYPKFGPGQMWEEVAAKVTAMGGEIVKDADVTGVRTEGGRVVGVDVRHPDGRTERLDGDHFFSTMPVRELVAAMSPAASAPVSGIAGGLLYRDFLTVGLLLKKLSIRDGGEDRPGARTADNWIYIQEPDVRVGRMQIFNNWSPALVADPETVWVGLEYFCEEGDDLWRMDDRELAVFGAAELEKIGIAKLDDMLDATVIRMPKAYPGYFGTYDRFAEVRAWLDGFENLWLVGRNGMHKYNNQDHSMLTAMTAVDNIAAGRTDKANVWAVNTEDSYHEERS
ncbi:MAG TPA: NAD(P)/FAD-dependent oxidoreductase [Candidatus Eisenbacteria bacterium]|nr:NAD(P)/FAD-dependent oxidoreductase [Candidatus Eisenbacteria bacterium]